VQVGVDGEFIGGCGVIKAWEMNLTCAKI